MGWIRTVAASGALAVVGLLGVGAWSLLGAEPIPEQLEAPGDPDTVVIAGIGDQPDLAIAAQRGKTAFFVMVGVAGWGSEEGDRVNRALNRWEYPDSTVGYIVFDAEGFGWLAESSQKYLREFSTEARFPMYGDFEGQFRRVFKLAQGHHGLVVLGPDGAVKFRHSGGLDDPEDLEALRIALGAREPPPGPPAPDFELGSISDEACADRPCALIFLGQPVARPDIPKIEGGFEGEDEQRWAQMRKPEVRMVAAALRLPLGEAAHGVIVGSLAEDLELPGWDREREASALAEALGVAPGTSAFVIIAGDRVTVRMEGLVPYYQFGRIAEELGVEFVED